MAITNAADDLPQILPRRSLLQRGLPYLCLFLLGLMVTLPFLQPVRVKPIIHFYSEWLALTLGLGTGFALLAHSFWGKLSAPKLAVYLFGLMALIAIQTILIKPTYTAQALLPLLYLSWAILLTVLVTWLREQLGLGTILRILAYFVLFGGLLHALFGAAQYLNLYGWLDGLIQSKQLVSITGNIGQQNHFAAHVTLAALAMSYLFALRHLSRGLVVPLVILFSFILALSSSRSVALYALGAFALSLLAYRKTGNDSHRRLAWLTGLLLALFLLFQYSLPWLNEWIAATLAHLGFETGHLEILTATQRGASGIEQRLVEWHKAWLMFLSAPLFGVGIGNYGWHSFMLSGFPETAGATQKIELYHHAHNIFMEVLAELGATGGLLLLLLLITWLRQFLKNWLTPESWFIAAVLLVLFIHGNLEYPYWYSYFLGILVIFLALGDARRVPIIFTPRLGQIGAAASLFLLFAILAVTFAGYRQLTNINAIVLMQSPEEAARTLRAISMNPLLTPWADATTIAHSKPDKSNIERQLELTTRVMRHQPDYIKVRQQIMYLALAGRMDDALSLLKHSARAYASVFPYYICDFKRLPDKEILPLIAEGERILGESPTCQTKDKTRVRPFLNTGTS